MRELEGGFDNCGNGIVALIRETYPLQLKSQGLIDIYQAGTVIKTVLKPP